MVEYIRYFLNPKKIKELTMSNFFSRSKGDMKYLFKKKETLSKKERRQKRLGNTYRFDSYISPVGFHCAFNV